MSATCEGYWYVSRASDLHPQSSHGWVCACGQRCERATYPSRQAAMDAWAEHRNEAK